MDLMIGLDMLKRHKCCVNLAENVLTVGDHTRVPFLPEAELPAFAKLPAGNSASEPNTLIGQPQEVRMRSPLLVGSVDIEIAKDPDG